MSCRRLLVKAAVLTIAAWAGAFALQACGPFFPHWLLTDEAGLLEAPTTWFKDSIESVSLPRKPGPRPPQLKAVVDRERAPTGRPRTRTWRMCRPPPRTGASPLPIRRCARLSPGTARRSPPGRRRPRGTPSPAAPRAAGADSAGGFAGGDRRTTCAGRWRYHRGRLRGSPRRLGGAARTAGWPSAASARSGPPSCSARRACGRTPRIPRQPSAGSSAPASWPPGLAPDPLGLAASSLGWQARAEMSLQRPDRALELYYDQMKAGDPSAISPCASRPRSCSRTPKP